MTRAELERRENISVHSCESHSERRVWLESARRMGAQWLVTTSNHVAHEVGASCLGGHEA